MMKKSLLTASVISAISTLISGVAFANTNYISTYCKPGFYAGVQGGITETFYSPSSVLSQAASNGAGTTISTTNFYDATNTLLFSILNTTGSYTTLLNQNVDDMGIGGRVFAGYQFNPYFATELGFTQYGKTDFSATGVTSSDTFQLGFNANGTPAGNTILTSSSNTTTNYSGNVTEHAIDLVGKGTLPLYYGFGVYVKAGVAYIEANRYINSNEEPGTTTTFAPLLISSPSNLGAVAPYTTSTTYTNTNNISTLYEKTYQAFHPTFGAGIDYTIPTTNFDVDVSWTRVSGEGAIPNADLWALGVSYKFA